MTDKSKFEAQYKSLEELKQLPPSDAEVLKENSNYLRGTIQESLANPLTGSLVPDDQLLIKFHGTYQQQDRDLDHERKKPKAGTFVQLFDSNSCAREVLLHHSSGWRLIVWPMNMPMVR